ncbi:hypothetical protein B0T25DRAFT_565814 [Lasiosphaeria hispida]|uniref:Uncharacterized protein n=1 Tax=Lasiosphaeria hispida TaxID=260671 RepID=A0AAJ0HKW8_9PEZI|nr:hypothetical protein B0T25DRAFT_565814 [Lasiosphaeria hispida]
MWKIKEMHEMWPHCQDFHIIDPDFYRDLYASSRDLDKYRWWKNLAGADGSGFSTVPHDLHRLRRGALNGSFGFEPDTTQWR